MSDPSPHAADAASGRRLWHREAVRVLLLDAAGRVLLMRGGDPADPAVRYWFSVGGGLDPGESWRDGAVREVHEETGLVLAPESLVATGHRETAEFGFGERWVVQHQQYVLARVDDFVIAPAALEAFEVATVDAWSWWSRPQLLAQRAGTPHDGPGEPGEEVFPRQLPELLTQWDGLI